MSTKIIVVRHGFSVANKLKVFTGQSNIELTDVGREQARLCGEFLGATGKEYLLQKYGIKKIDAIYASDLLRAYDTALPISRITGIEIQKCEKLREIYAGSWEMMPFLDIDETYKEEYFVWKNDIGKACCVDGESVAELFERVKNAVYDISKKHDGGCVVLVTHATPIRVMCALSEGIPCEDMRRVPWVSNASLNIFEFDGALRALDTNVTCHIGDLKTDLPRGV